MRFYFLILLTFSSVTFSNTVPTIEEYQQRQDTGLFDGYLYGLENGLDWGSEYAYRKHDVVLFCKPNDIMLPVSEIKKMINEELEIRKSFYQKYKKEPLLGLALRNAFTRNFPCN
ncbi:MAG: hypothetical protein CMD65_00935 [Gammaproteobacteria bacterium]|nr:hypothetical protein [Gammaproteobacteria bacterium]|tara:strand:- start:2847 stop:3191 length:345 start_codon:yes stop_codon:yes gene_type:complete